MEKEQKRKLCKMGLPIIMGTILLLGVSYAWLSLTLNGTKTNVLKAGTLSLTLTDTATAGINMEGVVPMLDEVGVTTSPYTFTLKNNGTIESEYTIYLDDVALSSGETKLPDTVIKYNLVKDGVSKATKLLDTTGVNPNRVLDSGVIKPNETYNYDLRLWLDENATREIAGQVFKGKIRVVAEQTGPKAVTPESCFEFDSSTGTITEYKCQYTVEGYPVIEDVVIPNTINGVAVKKIGNSAFYRYSGGTGTLNSVVIPGSVTDIGEMAFYETYLKKVTFSEGLETIGNNAFEFCNLTTLIFPSTIREMQSNSFQNNQLTSVTFKGTLACYEAGACGNIFEHAWADGYSNADIVWNG